MNLPSTLTVLRETGRFLLKVIVCHSREGGSAAHGDHNQLTVLTVGAESARERESEGFGGGFMQNGITWSTCNSPLLSHVYANNITYHTIMSTCPPKMKLNNL